MKTLTHYIYICFFAIFLFIPCLGTIAKATNDSCIILDVTDNTIANCSIDGKTDDYKALSAILDYVNSTSTPIKLIFPYTGTPMLLSDTIYIRRSNVSLSINCDIRFTKTKYSDSETMNVFEIGYSRYSRTPISNIQIIGDNIEINGNGSKLSFTETAHTKPNYGDIIHLRRVTDGYISGITCNNATENGMRIYMCQNITVEKCVFKNTKLDNGLTVMGLPVYDEDWFYNNNTCNNNVTIRNCKAYNNKDVGFSASICRNVLFDTCYSYNNGSPNGFNAGGGFSHECLGFATYYGEPNTWNGLTTFYKCIAYNNHNYGFYTDAHGTIINNCTVDTVIQNKSDYYGRNIHGGNGIYAMSAKGAVSILNTTIKNTDAYAISFSNSSSSISSALNIEDIIITDTAKGIYCYKTDLIKINTATLKNIPVTPLNFMDGPRKPAIILKNFNTNNIGKLLINNADQLIVDNSVIY